MLIWTRAPAHPIRGGPPPRGPTPRGRPRIRGKPGGDCHGAAGTVTVPRARGKPPLWERRRRGRLF